MEKNNLPQNNFKNSSRIPSNPPSPPCQGGIRNSPPDKGGWGVWRGANKVQLCAIMLVFFLSACGVKNNNYENIKKAEIKINNTTITADVVETPEEQIQGLSGREKLGENEGMLFVYFDKEIRTFWMKDMLFPIDIIWIADNKIIDISENLLIPENGNIKRATSKEGINYVLEVNAEFVKDNDLKVGDEVQIIKY
ncbi:MAG: DUF192 domain-containing protein [bacterium]